MDTEFAIGSKVKIITLPPYIKTADPMPMLRPPHVIQLGEEGVVVSLNPGGYWGVRFMKGTFLMDSQYLEAVGTDSRGAESTGAETDNSDLDSQAHIDLDVE